MALDKLLSQNDSILNISGEESADNWTGGAEGRLSVDVIEAEKELIVIATMAGAESGSIEVNVEADLLTIRGQRKSPIPNEKIDNVYYEECFWGTFSRTIVLPIHVKSDKSKASYRNGVLVVKIQKDNTGARVPITIVED